MTGANVLATGRRAARRQAIEELGGIPINPADESLREAAQNLEGGVVDLVADSIGTEQSVQEGLASLRSGGKPMVIGYLADAFSIPSLDFMLGEKELIGCRGSTKKDLQQVVELVDKKKLKPMIGATVPLAQFDRAAETLEQGEVVGRIVLTR